MKKVNIIWKDEDLLRFNNMCHEHFSKIDTEILKKYFSIILTDNNEKHKKDSEDYEGRRSKND